MFNKIYVGDNIDTLKTLPDESVNCCITSPPYYGLRDYGTGKWVGGDPDCPHRRMSKYSENTATGHAQPELAGNVGDAIYKTVCPLCGAVREDKQVGLEETPEEYIARLVSIFREVRRVLKPEGTLWVNIGDSYSASGKGRGADGQVHSSSLSAKQGTNIGSTTGTLQKHVIENCKPKDLIGIPWMLAFALRDDGWYLRQDIIWHKPNPMPESVMDRCTKSHEYIFLLSKSSRYYFDCEAIQEPTTTFDTVVRDRETTKLNAVEGRSHMGGLTTNAYTMRHKRDVWTVNPSTFKGAHFATFPQQLVEPMILAGCPVGGVVLDPFMGAGTVALVAKKHNRQYVGCELNPEYVKLAEQRIESVQRTLF